MPYNNMYMIYIRDVFQKRNPFNKIYTFIFPFCFLPYKLRPTARPNRINVELKRESGGSFGVSIVGGTVCVTISFRSKCLN